MTYVTVGLFQLELGDCKFTKPSLQIGGEEFESSKCLEKKASAAFVLSIFYLVYFTAHPQG